MSWDERFANRYEEWSAAMTADIAFYAALAREAEGPLVELAIGNGRVAIPVAQATGRGVVAVEAELHAIERGRELEAQPGFGRGVGRLEEGHQRRVGIALKATGPEMRHVINAPS